MFAFTYRSLVRYFWPGTACDSIRTNFNIVASVLPSLVAQLHCENTFLTANVSGTRILMYYRHTPRRLPECYMYIVYGNLFLLAIHNTENMKPIGEPISYTKLSSSKAAANTNSANSSSSSVSIVRLLTTASSIVTSVRSSLSCDEAVCSQSVFSQFVH